MSPRCRAGGRRLPRRLGTRESSASLEARCKIMATARLSPRCFVGELHRRGCGLRSRARELPDDYFVCLAGVTITEEVLPTNQTWLNTLEGVRDETGCSDSPWGVWNRAWTAEENRHGDLLNGYLYISGRVDMRVVERTIQYLIGSGMNVKSDQDPYNGFIYTSFQERATFISHENTARRVKEFGNHNLPRYVAP